MDYELQKNLTFHANFNYGKGENFMSKFLELPCLVEKWIQLTSTQTFLFYKPRNSRHNRLNMSAIPPLKTSLYFTRRKDNPQNGRKYSQMKQVTKD